MAICTFCDHEMKDAVTCREDPLKIGGALYDPIRWGEESRSWYFQPTARCGDCNTPRGGVHHHGCDLEQCPRCDGQALMCGCFDDLEIGEEAPASTAL